MTTASNVTEEAVLIDAVQVGLLLGVCRATVFKLKSAGKLPRPIKLGHSTRWIKAELLDWIAANCPPLGKWEAMRNPAAKSGRRA